VTKHPEFRHQTEHYYIRCVVSSNAAVQERSVQRDQIPQQVNTAVSYFEVVSTHRKWSDYLHRTIQGSALSFELETAAELTRQGSTFWNLLTHCSYL